MIPNFHRHLHRNPYKAIYIRNALSLNAKHPWPRKKRSKYVNHDLGHMAVIITFALDAYASGEVRLEKALRMVQAFSLENSSSRSRKNMSIDSLVSAAQVRERILVGTTAQLALGIKSKPLGENTPKISQFVKYLAGRELRRYLEEGHETWDRDTAAQSIADVLRLYGLADVKAGTVQKWGRNYNKHHGLVRYGRPPKRETKP